MYTRAHGALQPCHAASREAFRGNNSHRQEPPLQPQCCKIVYVLAGVRLGQLDIDYSEQCFHCELHHDRRFFDRNQKRSGVGVAQMSVLAKITCIKNFLLHTASCTATCQSRHAPHILRLPWVAWVRTGRPVVADGSVICSRGSRRCFGGGGTAVVATGQETTTEDRQRTRTPAQGITRPSPCVPRLPRGGPGSLLIAYTRGAPMSARGKSYTHGAHPPFPPGARPRHE